MPREDCQVRTPHPQVSQGTEPGFPRGSLDKQPGIPHRCKQETRSVAGVSGGPTATPIARRQRPSCSLTLCQPLQQERLWVSPLPKQQPLALWSRGVAQSLHSKGLARLTVITTAHRSACAREPASLAGLRLHTRERIGLVNHVDRRC